MNATTRRIYFSSVWPQAAKALGVAKGDDAARRAVTREAMRQVGGPETDSITALGAAEVTALFTYCRWLAQPDELERLSRWEDCRGDYVAYNLALQGDHYRRLAGYASRGKLERQRFGNRPTDGLFSASRMSREEAAQYLMTMRARARAAARRERVPEILEDNCPF